MWSDAKLLLQQRVERGFANTEFLLEDNSSRILSEELLCVYIYILLLAMKQGTSF